MFRRRYGTAAGEAIGSSADQSQRRSGRTGGASLRLGAIGLAGLVFLVGCHSGQPPTPAPTPTQPPSTAASATPVPFESVPPSATPDQAAIVAYRNMWAAFVEAGKTSDPSYPNLGSYATGDALTLIVRALTESRAQHKITLGTVALDPRVVEIRPPHDPTQIVISDCADSSKWLVYNDSGGLYNDVPGGRHSVSATVDRSADGWRVSAFTAGAVGTC